MLGELLIDIARNSISDAFSNASTIDSEKLTLEHSEFSKHTATFVTLTLNGQLRGCVGSITPYRSLLDDLASNARSAAFKDPRFMPLSREEFDEIEIEVSLLTEPQRFEYGSVDELKARVTHDDGVILKDGPYQATFLPQVWEQLPSFELFFSHLCEKAGLNAGCLTSHPEIYLYQVQKYKE